MNLQILNLMRDLFILLLVVSLTIRTGCLIHHPSHQPGIECRLSTIEGAETGESLVFAVTIRNSADSPRELALAGRPAEYMRVTTESGAFVWDSRHDQVVQDILEMKTLEPDEEWVVTINWNRVDTLGVPVMPGRYLAYGGIALDASEAIESEPHDILVPR